MLIVKFTTVIALSVSIPLVEPVLIIALVFTIIFIGPVLFEKIGVPAIVGLILCGALIGEHGLNLIGENLEFTLLGTIGLLYLMFLAGLEIDMIDFLENRLKSIAVGLLSFVLPFLLGFFVSRYLLNLELHASWLIGAMLSSHTLVSYPLLGRLGIISKPVVTIIVGATIIADVLALVAMELIVDFAEAQNAVDTILIMILKFAGFFLLILFVIPRFSRFFLSRYQGELGVQYIFVLVILFLSAMTAHLLEFEPILGAFFSGLVINRQIIRTSPLFKRIEFIGNTLFIPFFLISIGMLANFRVYVEQPEKIGVLAALIALAFLSKYLAAFFSGRIFRLSTPETNLIFGMSVSRAASAIAIILIGFNAGIVRESVLNNTVILILVTSIVSSYVTQRAGIKLLRNEEDTIGSKKRKPQKLLIPVSNPDTMGSLLDFAIMVKDEDHDQPLYPLMVFADGNKTRQEIDENMALLNKRISKMETDVHFETSSRIDNNVTNGILRATEEKVATGIIIGWNNHNIPRFTSFGNVMKNLIRKSDRMLMVLKTPVEFRQIRNIHVFVTDDAEYEEGFHLWMDMLTQLFRRLQIKALIYSESMHTLDAVQNHGTETRTSKYFELYRDATPQQIEEEIQHSRSDLLIFIHSRKKTVSFNKGFEQFMNQTITRYDNNNVLVIYPEQW